MYDTLPEIGDKIYVTNPVHMFYKSYGTIKSVFEPEYGTLPNIEATFTDLGMIATCVLRRNEYWIVGKDTFPEHNWL